MVDEAFNKLDTDKDEILNMDELFNGFLTNSEIYQECGEELKEKMETAVAEFDHDSNRQLNLEEFRAMV